jgi:hypothetical protein
MAVRGEIVVECDVPTCHAELIISAVRARSIGVDYAVWDAEWKVDHRGLYVCEQCAIERGMDGKP